MNIFERATENLSKFGDRTFLIEVSTNRSATYKEFHDLACAFAAELGRCGISKGQRVAVMAPNCLELAALYFGCMYAGAVIVPLNPNLNAPELEFILSNCKPELALASPSCLVAMRKARPDVRTFLVASEPTPDSGKDLLQASSGSNGFSPGKVDATDLFVIMYTSGTTQRPKGLAHRIGSTVRNAEAFAKLTKLDPETRFYNTLSMAYMGGFYNLTLLPFLCGASVVLDHVFDARSTLTFWDTVSRHSCNALWMAPTVMSVLLKMDRGHQGEDYCRRAMRHTFVGFAPLPNQVKEQFERRYGVSLIENYGLSETLFLTARIAGAEAGSGCVGTGIPGVELRIVDDSGNPQPHAREGEIQVNSPDLMVGYLDDQGSVISNDRGPWFATGDCGYLTGEGSLFITGRKKDLIIRGGVNISPSAIEEGLRLHPGITDVAVVSIPHELYGEDIAAVLKLEPGVELDAIRASLVAHARETLADHQQPSRYLSTDEFPRTATGKVQKARLRELVLTKLQLGGILDSSTLASVCEA